MWPIFFVVAYYVVIYLVVAGGVYVCFSVVAGHDRLGKRLFAAVLAFGAGSLAGYIAADVLNAFLHSPVQPFDEPNRFLLMVAYVVPGLVGGLASWKWFKPST